jgi:uncharacterized membrane protein YhiD involved in acid resistance
MITYTLLILASHTQPKTQKTKQKTKQKRKRPSKRPSKNAKDQANNQAAYKLPSNLQTTKDARSQKNQAEIKLTRDRSSNYVDFVYLIKSCSSVSDLYLIIAPYNAIISSIRRSL